MDFNGVGLELGAQFAVHLKGAPCIVLSSTDMIEVKLWIHGLSVEMHLEKMRCGDCGECIVYTIQVKL